MLLDARPRFVIASEEHAGKLDCCEGVVLSIDRLEDVIAQQFWSNLDCLTRREDAAYAAFTSGSTGRPKAAIVTHRALANHTREVARMLGDLARCGELMRPRTRSAPCSSRAWPPPSPSKIFSEKRLLALRTAGSPRPFTAVFHSPLASLSTHTTKYWPSPFCPAQMIIWLVRAS
jgi:acyl-CoA synthetase (AMP-forming)/AMP-acid ligase II